MKWNEIVKDEKQLISWMECCQVPRNGEVFNPRIHVRGYGYIASFQKQYKEKGYLTSKQITQLKRLANAIYEHLRSIHPNKFWAWNKDR